MNTINRVIRHARISWKNQSIPSPPSPPFLIFFINSICNLKCEHCFYWRNLNRPDDLTLEEIFASSDQLGRIENLNLSGGEPFLRKEFAKICRYFIQNNHVEQIYVPTNAYFTERIVRAVGEVLKELRLKLFAVEISLDGTIEYHNRLSGSDRSFQKTMDIYDALGKLQISDARLRIYAVSTVTNDSIDEVRKLTNFLYRRCPQMESPQRCHNSGRSKKSILTGTAAEGI